MRWLLKNDSLRQHDRPGRRTARRRPSRRQVIPMVEGFEDRLLLSGGNPAGTTLWSSSATPQNPAEADSSALEVGVKFTADVAGTITGIRFYKDGTNTGTHVGDLWSSTGQKLASATFGDETASGWQQVNFATPVAIQPNTVYVASYHTDVGHYADDTDYFNVGYDAAPLHAPADGASSPNGVYAYGSTSTFPNNGYQASNYWVDVVFSSGLAVAPTVISVAPISGAADASTGTSVAATFSTAMDPATINGGTFRLLDPSGNPVPATVSYSTYTDTARLTPVASLAPATTYTAAVRGGPSGVEDAAGNPMAADYSWSFTTATPQPGPAPVVAMTWPAAGAVGVDPGGVITATFNVEMDLKTITTDTVQLLDPTGASVPIGVTYGGETATVTITPLGMGLAPGATYTTAIKGGGAGVKSLAGTPMAADYYTWSFTTRTAPTAISVAPISGATDASTRTSVAATFGTAMDPKTINAGTFVLLDPSGARVPATVSYCTYTDTARLTPVASLAPATTYTAVVKGGPE